MTDSKQTQAQEQDVEPAPPATGIFAGAGPVPEQPPVIETIYSGDPAAAMAKPDPTVAADGSDIPPNTGATLVSQDPAPAVTEAPVNVDTPLVYQDGAQLHCTMGNWEHVPTSYSYAWSSSGAPVGIDQATYDVTPEMVGFTFTCVVTAQNAGGSTAAQSNECEVVEPPAP